MTASPYQLVLPRLSFSFPVTDNTVFYAQYGKYAQMPSLNNIYVGNTALSRTVSPITRGNAYLTPVGFLVRPERTTQYEMGIRQVLSGNFAFTLQRFLQGHQGPDPGPFRPGCQWRRALQSVSERRLRYGEGHRAHPRTPPDRTFRSARELHAVRCAWYGFQQPDRALVHWSRISAVRHRSSIRWISIRHTVVPSCLTTAGVWMRADRSSPVWVPTSWPPSTAAVRTPRSRNSRNSVSPIRGPWVSSRRTTIGTASRPNRSTLRPRRSPSILTCQVSKMFKLGPLGLEVYVNVLNLLNTKQVVMVYPTTGSAQDDGFMSNPLSAGYRQDPELRSILPCDQPREPLGRLRSDRRSLWNAAADPGWCAGGNLTISWPPAVMMPGAGITTAVYVQANNKE